MTEEPPTPDASASARRLQRLLKPDTAGEEQEQPDDTEGTAAEGKDARRPLRGLGSEENTEHTE
ncbi:hypothetical protein ACWD6P_02630 [Streptomyces sp. NPDC002446]